MDTRGAKDPWMQMSFIICSFILYFGALYIY